MLKKVWFDVPTIRSLRKGIFKNIDFDRNFSVNIGETSLQNKRYEINIRGHIAQFKVVGTICYEGNCWELASLKTIFWYL